MSNQKSLESPVVVKKKRIIKWQWFDYLIIVLVAVVVLAIAHVGILGAFVIGAIFGLIYNFTLLLLWARLFPRMYGNDWQCTKCKAVFRGEAIKCPKCGIQFEDEPAPQK